MALRFTRAFRAASAPTDSGLIRSNSSQPMLLPGAAEPDWFWVPSEAMAATVRRVRTCRSEVYRPSEFATVKLFSMVIRLPLT